MEYNNFQDRVTGDLARRKKELIDLKQLVQFTQNEDAKDILRRAILPLQYAHWEGFIKFLGVAVLNYISDMHIKYVDLLPTFSAIGIYRALRSSVPESDLGRTMLLMRFVSGHFREDLENELFDLSNCQEWVDTKSNLNKKVLEELLFLFGIRLSEIRNNEHIENNWLDVFLGRRNKIAHGGLDKVGQDDFEESADRIVALLDLFSGVFLDYVEHRRFLR